MDISTQIGEPIGYDAAEKMEAAGISPVEAGRMLVAVGLSRVRTAIVDRRELSEELNELSAMLAMEAEALLQDAVN